MSGRPAARHGAQAAAEEGFEFGNEGVAAEGPTPAGAQADLGEEFVLVRIAEDAPPLGRVPFGSPGGQVEQAGGVIRTAMGCGAAPAPFPGLGAEACSDGVSLHVGEGPPEVEAIEGAGIEAVLPEMAMATVHAIDVLCVELVRAFEGLGQGGLLLRFDDQMNVVGHQAIALYTQGVSAGGFAEVLEIGPAVGVHKEHVLAVAGALCDVVGALRDHRSCLSGHSRFPRAGG